MHAARIVVCLLGLCTGLADSALAQTATATQPERSSSPDAKTRLQGAALLRALRDGGLVVYFRHTATDFSRTDQGMANYDDCANQRPLSEQGRSDAQLIGKRIAALKLPLGEVRASPMCRTMEHARLMLGQVTPTPAMRELAAPGEYPGLKQLLSARVPAGTNRWMVGHGTPLLSVAGPPRLAEGEAIVLRPTGNGWVVLARLMVNDWAALPAR
jgi:hypothetical protein